MKSFIASAALALGAFAAQNAVATTLVVEDYGTGTAFTRQCEVLDFVLDTAAPKSSSLVADCASVGFNTYLLGAVPTQVMPQLGNFDVPALFKPKTNCFVGKYDSSLEYIKVICKKTFSSVDKR